MRTIVRTLWGAAAFVGLTIALGVAPAAGHAALASTEPANGSTIRTFDRVVIRFEEEVEAEGSHVLIHDGVEAQTLGPVRYGDDHKTLVVDVPRIRDGAYTVVWHVLALDGDPVAGQLTFTLDSAAAAAPGPVGAPAAAEPAHAHDSSPVPASSARMLVDLALASLVGGFAFVALVWPGAAGLGGARQVLFAAVVAAAAATVVLAVVQRDTAAVDWGELLRLHIGRIAVARLALLALALVPIAALRRGGEVVARSPWWRAGTAAISLGLLETVVVAGHAGKAVGIDATARLVHTIGLSVWLGGLLMLFLVVLPRRRRAELDAVLPRFSAYATGAVGIVVVGGILLSADLLGSVSALPDTTYGRILLVKVVVVTLLVAAASRSRAHVHHRLQGTATATPIATWVGIELALVAVVFTLTALLVSHAPPA